MWPGHHLTGDNDHEGAPAVAPDVRPRLPKEPYKLLPGVYGAAAAAGAGVTNRAAPDAVPPPAARNGYPPQSPRGESIRGGPGRGPRDLAGEAPPGCPSGHVEASNPREVGGRSEREKVVWFCRDEAVVLGNSQWRVAAVPDHSLGFCECQKDVTGKTK